MTRRRRAIIFLTCGAIVIVLAVVALILNKSSSPVGAWSLADASDWIEFSNQKNEDLFSPAHDGIWTRHHGKDSTGEGMWVRVPGDRQSFDMITHVSGPMWEKDGRLTLSGQSAEWKRGFGSDQVMRLTRR
jgi:hypothetical protein